DDGETHQGLYDISLFISVPNMTLLAPAGAEELKAMLEWALAENTGPVMIRYPKDKVPDSDPAFSVKIKKGRGVFIKQSFPLALSLIIFTGSLYAQVREAGDLLDKQGFPADLYNLRFIKPLDEDYLAGIMNNYEFVLVAEEGIKASGIGVFIAELAIRKNCSCRIKVLGVSGKFDAQGKRGRLLSRNSLDGEEMAAAVMEMLADTAETKITGEVFAEI
ncbi:MAG: 1-deoxy-D-xylulose-5-phosphate synthase, partial [Treponema sp.]|nr:1-deoxy-D-xylulose-5-phosphate synthase [Treponema sp.]